MIKKSVTILLFILYSWTYAQKPIFTTAKVKAATVYFNAAEIQQTTSINLPAGNSEIVIKNVADNLNENTVQIGAPNSVTVLSVQFTKNYISEYEIDESNPVIKKVRDSINIINKEIAKIEITKTSHSKTIEILDKKQQDVGIISGLNVMELTKLIEYYNSKRTELNNTISSLQEKENKFNEQLDNLNKKLVLNSAKEDKTSKGKIVLHVMNETAGIVNLDINYVTNNATWNPFYDLRAENVKDPINLMYKAQVVQNTGIDWKNVKLTLSSGNPNQNNQAPILSAWFLRNVEPYRRLDLEQNAMRNQIQSIGYVKDKKVATTESATEESTVSDYTTIIENQLNITFDIDVPYDILSNGKNHSVSLKEIKVPATYKYYAVPKAENEAFLLAEIANYSKYNLLKGEANIIFEGMYVGKTLIEPNQTKDTLNLSMGRDKKVSVKREKVVDKSGTKFLSSKKEQTFTYDITVRNSKKEAVDLLLKDQYPLSTNKDIEVELLQSDSAKINTETGILTWQLSLKPNETRKVRMSYKVKYPKDQNLNL